MFLATLTFPAFAEETFDGKAFYFGDIHSHTGASGDGGASDLGTCSSGACGAVADYIDTALENQLDFLGTVDHINNSGAGAPDAAAFDSVFQMVNAADQAGIVTLPGAEIFFEVGGAQLGHKSLLLFGDSSTVAAAGYNDLLGSDPASNEVADCAAITAFMDGLQARFGPALLIPHHPGGKKPMPTDWACHDLGWGPAVEAWSEHGSSMDSSWSWDPPWSGWTDSGSVISALESGLALGVAGGTDNHDTHPGQVCGMDTIRTEHWYSGALTVVVLDEGASFDRNAIYEAFVNRKTYLTTGPQLPVRAQYDVASGAQLFMGDALDTYTAADGDVVVTVTFPAERDTEVIEVMVHGPADAFWEATRVAAGEYAATVPAAEINGFLIPHLVLDGSRWWGEAGCDDGYENYDAGGAEDGLEHLVLSPSFFGTIVPPADKDGDGYSQEEGDCNDENPAVHPGAAEDCESPKDEDCDGLVETDPDCLDTGDADADTDVDADTDSDADTDTDTDADADADTGTADTGEPPADDCGCDEGSGLLLPALGLLALRRRARR